MLYCRSELMYYVVRLSPRATQDVAGTLLRVRTTQAAKTATPGLSLQDTASDIDWHNLVDAASKFDGQCTPLYIGTYLLCWHTNLNIKIDFLNC